MQAHRAAAGHRSTIGFSVAHLNARSLFISDKFNEISALILSNAFDIFAVSETWLGFCSSDSTVMQLVYIVNKIYDCLDRGNEVRAVFLDISKAFDKVWHAGLLAKMKNLGVGGTLLNWFESYPKSRQQRVVIEGSSSSWKEVKAGVPQGSVLGPLLFLIYINDIQQNIDSDCFIFADDTMLLEEVFSPQSAARSLNKDLNSISLWSNRWLVTMNASKTKSMTFSLKKKINLIILF